MAELRRVLKLGGSLLARADWWPRLRRWHEEQPTAQDWLVVGGGRWVDRLREVDGQCRLGEVPCHMVALGLMSVTARYVGLRSGWRVVDRADQLGQPGPLIVDVGPLAEGHSGPYWSLPQSWEVTSDSLAARLAAHVNADELVLLKSRGCREAVRRTATRRDYEAWAAEGLVDRYFPEAVAEATRVRIVPLAEVGGS